MKTRPWLLLSVLFLILLAYIACGQHGYLTTTEQPVRRETASALLDSTVENSVLASFQGTFTTDPVTGTEVYNAVLKPSDLNSNQLNLLVRHMGTEFFNNKPGISSSQIQNLFGQNISLLGAANPSAVSATPTFLGQSGDSFGFYFDSRQLNQDGFIPFSQKYCQKVGLGAPHFIHSKDFSAVQDVRPWKTNSSKLVMSVEAKLPLSEIKARNTSGSYLVRDYVDASDNAPIFISTLFFYLRDTKTNKTIAVLFSYYDPRGYAPGSVMNDHNSFFYTTYWPSPGHPANNDEYSADLGILQSRPFSDFKSFQISINKSQIQKIIARFPVAEGLSNNPEDYILTIAGLLNELNFLYANPAECLPNYDPQTYARHSLVYKNLRFEIQ